MRAVNPRRLVSLLDAQLAEQRRRNTAWHATALVRRYRGRLLIVIINDSAERIDWSHADLDLTAPWSWSVVDGRGNNLIDGTSPTAAQAQSDAQRFVDEEARHGR